MAGQSQEVTRRHQGGSAIVPRDYFSAGPFSLIRRMSEEMDRVFGDYGMGRGPGDLSVWSPAMEVTERDGNYVISADLPGMRPEDIKVEVTNDALIVEGERKWKNSDNRSTEIRYGRFYRTLPLPDGVNPDQIKARFEHGVLEVTIPVPEKKDTKRQISVEGGTSAQGSQQTGTSAQGANQGSSQGSNQGSTQGSTQGQGDSGSSNSGAGSSGSGSSESQVTH